MGLRGVLAGPSGGKRQHRRRRHGSSRANEAEKRREHRSRLPPAAAVGAVVNDAAGSGSRRDKAGDGYMVTGNASTSQDKQDEIPVQTDEDSLSGSRPANEKVWIL